MLDLVETTHAILNELNEIPVIEGKKLNVLLNKSKDTFCIFYGHADKPTMPLTAHSHEPYVLISIDDESVDSLHLGFGPPKAMQNPGVIMRGCVYSPQKSDELNLKEIAEEIHDFLLTNKLPDTDELLQ